MSLRPSWTGVVMVIWKKELWTGITTLKPWVFVSGFLALAGGFFSLSVAASPEASLRSVLPNWTVLLLLGAPLLTMNAYASERRQGSLDLLHTAPISRGAILVGKWLASWTFLALLLGLTLPLTSVLWLYGDPDVGVLVTTYLGLWACTALFTAVGLLAAAVGLDATGSAVLCLVLLVPSWLAGAARSVGWVDAGWLEHFSVGHHLHSFSVGLLDTGDLTWFGATSVGALFLAWRLIAFRRWR